MKKKDIVTENITELLEAVTEDSIIPKAALTKQVKEAISTLSQVYELDKNTLKAILTTSLTEDCLIDIDVLKKSTREWHHLSQENRIPKLSERTQPLQYQTMQGKKPATQEEQLIQQLEQVSPRQLLIDMSGGAEPSSGDLKIIEDIMFNQKLPAGVVNVLIQYVLIKADMKLTKGYIEKIASHWARKRVKTVKEAMDLARKENRQYQDWQKNQEQKPKQVDFNDITKLDSIRGAIKAGLNNEQLGNYVRNLLSKSES